MRDIYISATEALKAAYNMAKDSGKRVWRHSVVDNKGSIRRIISHDRDAHTALQELAA